MEEKELMSKLNGITAAEFKANWSYGEMKRIVVNDTNKESSYNKLAKELEKELNGSVEDGYVWQVSGLGFAVLYKRVNKYGIDMLNQVKTITSENTKIIPYSYIMGKPVSKTVYEKTLALLKD